MGPTIRHFDIAHQSPRFNERKGSSCVGFLCTNIYYFTVYVSTEVEIRLITGKYVIQQSSFIKSYQLTKHTPFHSMHYVSQIREFDYAVDAFQTWTLNERTINRIHEGSKLITA